MTSTANAFLDSFDLVRDRTSDTLRGLDASGNSGDEGGMDAFRFGDPGIHSPIEGVGQRRPRAMFVVTKVDLHTDRNIPTGMTAVKKKISGESSPLPEWAVRIRQLREKLGENQEKFARRLGVTQAAVSRWEKGVRQPDAKIYCEMGIAAGSPDGYWFLRAGGISDGVIFEKDAPPSAKFEPPPIYVVMPKVAGAKVPDACVIPLLRDSAAAGVPREIRDDDVEDFLLVRRSTVKHPEKTVAFRVVGDSMSPTLEDGYVVVVDLTYVDRRLLFNQMVAARAPDGGVTIKWFRNVGGEEMLIPQHTSPRFPPILVSKEPGWRIIGRVLFWIGKPA